MVKRIYRAKASLALLESLMFELAAKGVLTGPEIERIFGKTIAAMGEDSDEAKELVLLEAIVFSALPDDPPADDEG